MRGTWLGLGLGLLAASCSLSSNSDAGSKVAINECRENADCGSHGRCANGRCEALQGTFDSLLFEIAVPGTSTADVFAGLTFLALEDKLPLAGGQRDLSVPDVAEVRGRITLPASVLDRTKGCGFDFAKAPLGVTFTPRLAWTGLVANPTKVKATCPAWPCTPEFSVALPPGDYDVYIEPDSNAAVAGASCELVPQAFSAVKVLTSTELGLNLSDPTSLSLYVRWLVPGGLDGWVMDVLEPISGRRLSASVVLTRAQASLDAATGCMDYRANIAYVPSPNALPGSELVSLVPPEGVTAPTFLFQRSAVQLINGTATLVPLTEVPARVTIEGTLMDGQAGGGRPISGTVRLIAKAQGLDDVEPGTIASLTRSVQAGDDGRFQVDLLPGKYTVRALPPDRCPAVVPCPGGEQTCDCPLGASEVEWVVGKSPAYQAGKTVALAQRTQVTGWANGPSGAPASGASVSIVSNPAQTTVLTNAFGEAPRSARASMGTVAGSGRFGVLADPGTFQLAIRPAAGTGFPWLVRSELIVDGMLAGEAQDLGSLAISLPVAYSGRVLVGTTVLPDVLLRAYVVSGPHLGTGQASVIQVAEASADPTGHFEILIPSNLDDGLSSGN